MRPCATWSRYLSKSLPAPVCLLSEDKSDDSIRMLPDARILELSSPDPFFASALKSAAHYKMSLLCLLLLFCLSPLEFNLTKTGRDVGLFCPGCTPTS